MALSSDTKWTIAVGASVLAAIGWAVIHLTSLQTEMERRLSANIAGTENRLTERIDRVDNRLTQDLSDTEGRLTEQITKLDTGLRTVEGETASLAGVEARLTQTIEASETRLSQGLEEAEQRLTAEIDQVEGRLLKVEGESAALAALVKNTWSPEEVLWPLQTGTIQAGKIAEMMGGEVHPVGNLDTLTKTMHEGGINVKWIAIPVKNPYASGPLAEAYRQTLKTHPEFAKAYREAILEKLGLATGGTGAPPASDTPPGSTADPD